MTSRDLLDQLRTEGTLERRGEFEIDRDKAREKLQKFQLPDPHAYVLELVKAATILGSTFIDFGIDADEMRMTFDCAPLTSDELDTIYGAAFSKLDSQRARALRHLAIGLTAAGALDLKEVIIESRSLQGGARYTSKDSGGNEPEECTEPTKPGPKRTTIYLKKSFKGSHIVGFFSKFADELAEMRYLREKVKFAELPIYLSHSTSERPDTYEPDSKHRISHGREIDTEYDFEFSNEHERGVLGLTSGPTSNIEITQYGVHIASHVLDVTPCFKAIVESSRLSTDLTQSAFVEDDAYHNLMRTIVESHLTQLLVRMFNDRHVNQWGPLDSSALLQSTVLGFLDQANKLPRDEWPEDFVRFTETLEHADIWPLAVRGPEPMRRFTSLGEIRDSAAIRISDKQDFRIELLSKFPVLFPPLEGRGTASIPIDSLKAYLNVPVQNVTQHVLNRVQQNEDREKWRDPSRFKADTSISFNVSELKCTLSVLKGGRDSCPTTIEWIKDESVNFQKMLPHGLMPWILLKVEGDIERNLGFTGPADNAANQAALVESLKKVPELFERYAAQERVGDPLWNAVLRRYMDAMVTGELLRPWVSLFSFDLDVDEVVSALRQHHPHFGVNKWPRKTHDQPDPAKHLADTARLLGSVGKAQIFQRLDGTWLSLEELADAIPLQNEIRVVHKRNKNTRQFISGQAREIQFGELYDESHDEYGCVIWTDSQLDQLLENLAGKHVVSVVDSLLLKERRRTFFQKPTSPYELPDDDYVRIKEYKHEYARFQVGLRRETSNHGRIQVRFEGRSLRELRPTVRVGSFDVVVELTKSSDKSMEGGTSQRRLADLFLAVDSAPQLKKDPRLAQLLDDIENRCIELLSEFLLEIVSSFEVVDYSGFEEDQIWSMVRDLREVPGGLDGVAVARDENSMGVFEMAPERFLKNSGIEESYVVIEGNGVRGAVTINRRPPTEGGVIRVHYCYESRVIERDEIDDIPFGSFDAIVESDDFALDSESSGLSNGKEGVDRMVRQAARESVLALCDAWDASKKIDDQTRGVLKAMLTDSVKCDPEGEWKKVSERLATTKISERPTGHWRSYKELLLGPTSEDLSPHSAAPRSVQPLTEFLSESQPKRTTRTVEEPAPAGELNAVQFCNALRHHLRKIVEEPGLTHLDRINEIRMRDLGKTATVARLHDRVCTFNLAHPVVRAVVEEPKIDEQIPFVVPLLVNEIGRLGIPAEHGVRGALRAYIQWTRASQNSRQRDQA